MKEERMRTIRGWKFMMDFTEDQHKNVKEMAHKTGMSMHEYIILAISELGSKLSKKKGWQ